jgi:chromosome partitioning protein
MAMTKGGVGKTTTIEAMASELRSRGYRILGLDADPERRLKAWAEQRDDPDMVVMDGINETNLRETVVNHSADYDFVFIDLAGFGNLTMLYSFGASDLVIIPVLTSAMDRDAASRTYSAVVQAMANLKHAAPARLLLNRTPAAIQPRILKHLRDDLEAEKLPVLPVELIDRTALVEMTWLGKGPCEMSASNRSAVGASENVRALTDTVISVLKNIELNPGIPRKKQAAVA